MTIFAIDPGPDMSALVVVNRGRVQSHAYWRNEVLVGALRTHEKKPTDVVVIEQIASFGMPVGAEVFETCVWSGRFIEAWTNGSVDRAWARIKRHEVKQALCKNQKAKDPHIRQALIDRFGPGKEKAIGKKASPGPLFGITGDEWSALAVAIAYIERNGAQWNKQ